MRLELTHPLPANTDSVWQLVFSDEFSVALDQRTGVRREKVSDEVKDGKQHTSFRIVHSEPLPKMAAKAMGTDTLVYFQDQVIDEPSKTVHWRVRLPSLGSKVQASGTYRLEPISDRCQRVVSGDISVRIPLIGSRVEKEIVKKLSASYDDSAKFIRHWLSKS